MKIALIIILIFAAVFIVAWVRLIKEIERKEDEREEPPINLNA